MTPWRLSMIGAIATLLVGLAFRFVPNIDACGPAQGAGQWVDFQNIDSINTVADLIRPECEAGIIPALKASMWLDALVFIPAYMLFLGALLIALHPPRWLLFTGLSLLLMGMLADQLEGYRLLGILNAVPGNVDDIRAVIHMRTAKELLLQLATTSIGLMLLPLWGWRKMVGGAILLVCTASLIATIAGLGIGEWGLLLAWLMLTIVALCSQVRTPERCI